MKKLFIISLLGLILSTSVQAQRKYNSLEPGQVGFGLVAGGSFILFGLLQQPDEKWIQDPNGIFINKNQRGYWRNETFWEDRNRIAAVASGLFIFGLSVTIKF